MKTKHLFIPLVILILLVTVGGLLRRPSAKSRSAVEQAGLAQLVAEKFGAERIRRITLSSPEPQGATIAEEPIGESVSITPGRNEIELIKSSDGSWSIKSSFNAPADSGKVAGLLAAIQKLSGDLHAERRDSHKALGVDADASLRIGMGLLENSDELVLHVGGRPGGASGESYVRRNDELEVYRVPVDLRRIAGLRYIGAKLETRMWLDMNLFSAAPDDIETVQFVYPGDLPTIRIEEVQATDNDAEWTLVEGGNGKSPKKESLSEWKRNLHLVKISDVVAPSLFEEAAAKGDNRSLTIDFNGGSGKKSIHLRIATLDGAHYLESSERPGIFYLMDEAEMNRAFPSFASIVDLRLLPNAETASRVEGAEWILTREIEDDMAETGRWLVASDESAYDVREVESATVESYLESLSKLEGIGFASVNSEPLAVEKTLTVRIDEKNIVLSFGPELNETRLVSIDGEQHPIIVKAADAEVLFHSLDDWRPMGTDGGAD